MQAQRIWRAGGPDDTNPASTWAEGLASAFVSLAVERGRDAPFAGAIEQAEAGPLKISRVRAVGHTVRRLAEQARDARADVVFLNLQVAGVGVTAQHGRERRNTPFDIAVADTLAPFYIAHKVPFEVICVAVPRELAPVSLLERGGLALGASAERRELAALLASQLRIALNPASREAAVALAARHFLDVVALAAGEAEPPANRPELTADHIRDYIGEHFRDPLVSAARAGRAFGVSERQVQKLLAQRGDTFSQTVAAARLEASARRLASADERSVAAIAYEMGFSDLSHFHRAFKARFGETPAGFRDSRLSG